MLAYSFFCSLYLFLDAPGNDGTNVRQSLVDYMALLFYRCSKLVL
jgi:hypothetical protein